MITYEKFKEIIVKYIHFTQCENKLRRMNIDVFESPLFDTTGYYLDWLWEAYFEEDAVDTINWWMFEYHDLDEDFDLNGKYVGDPDIEPGMWDKDDKVIPMITIEDLWNEVQDQRRKFVDSPKEALTKTITDMVSLHIQNAAEPADLDIITEVLGDAWEEISKYFQDTSKLVCVDNTDEAIADIMATYLDGKAPYKEYETDHCLASLFLDDKVGHILVLADDHFELYVWQG
ncbi:MAG: hypothetical protein IJ880_17265 [Bacilli bacterium]|nr:hypothetical protein [Bacilli bacterium]